MKCGSCEKRDSCDVLGRFVKALVMLIDIFFEQYCEEKRGT